MIEATIIISSLFFLALVYAIFHFLKLYDKKSQQYINEIEDIKHIYQNNLLSAQIEIQEQTFQNISREIHDNIGQKLSIAKMHMNILCEEHTDVDKDKINTSLILISQAINDLSDISRSLSSDLILDNGLIKALEFEIYQLKKLNKYQIDFNIEGEPVFLENKKELILFRIIQEGINNIIKHSDSKNISIGLNYLNNGLELYIQDSGKGFELVKGGQPFGTGLNNMMKRTQMMGGEFCSSSGLNQGTIIKVNIPYHYEIGKIQDHIG